MLLLAVLSLTAAEPRVEFNRDVRPILSDACFHCHGPDRAKRKGGLRLDTSEGAAALVAGKPDESELIQRLTHADPKKVMPPPSSGRKLTPAQKEILRKWVAQGGQWEPHWAFVAPAKSSPTSGGAHPIDAFIDATIRAASLTAQPRADKRTLIRRLSLDLLGLPPSLDDVEAFVADNRVDAYERLVDRLLASPRLGERLAYDWLDAARYADSNGYQSDRDRVMWPWRDWAVRAFNDNVPFDAFTVKQIAGDLLPNPTRDDLVATGFHRNHPLNGEGGRIAEESRVDYVVDRVDTTATVWLGVTLACARCHDHKYDPFTAKEYYRLYGYFNSIDESGAVDRGGNANPVLEMPTPEQEARRAELKRDVADLESRRNRLPARAKASGEKEAKAKRDALNALERQILSVMVMRDRATPRKSHVLVRGAYDQYGEEVTPGVISWLAPAAKDAPPNRLALARWLVDEKNPLTARVVVNRYWQLIFGAGLVKTVEDFGVQGELASHPELLDFLAVTFRESGWDLKRLLRLMVTSEAYKRSSRSTPELRERDPENRLLARAGRYRLASTVLRDQALALSGLLRDTLGGPPVKPYQPAGIWEEFSFGQIRYTQGKGDDLYRRSLYIFWRRTVGPTSLFDTATRQVCEVKPVRTNTPLHALTTLNDPTYAEAARVMAARVRREKGADERLSHAFRLATARTPSAGEAAVLARAYERLRARYAADPEAAKKLLSVGESPVPTADVAETAALAGVCAMVLNLDEVLTRE